MPKIKGFTIEYLGIITVYAIIFLLIGISLIVYKTLQTKETEAVITGIADSECMISAGSRYTLPKRHDGHLTKSTYGRKYYLKFNVGNKEFQKISSCSSSEYEVGETMPVRYNRNNPNISLQNKDIDKYIAIAIFFGVLMLSFGVTPISAEEK